MAEPLSTVCWSRCSVLPIKLAHSANSPQRPMGLAALSFATFLLAATRSERRGMATSYPAQPEWRILFRLTLDPAQLLQWFRFQWFRVEPSAEGYLIRWEDPRRSVP